MAREIVSPGEYENWNGTFFTSRPFFPLNNGVLERPLVKQVHCVGKTQGDDEVPSNKRCSVDKIDAQWEHQHLLDAKQGDQRQRHISNAVLLLHF